MTICQLQNLSRSLLLASFCGAFLAGCSGAKQVVVSEEKLIKPQWHKLPLRFADRDMDDNYTTHPFFDVASGVENKGSDEAPKIKMRYFVSTPVESKYQYNLDVYSGRLYRDHAYCPTDDIWDFYRGDVLLPNFSQGFVPRVYDERGAPQRLFIFSDKSHVEFKHHPTHYDEAQIIGSIILESCENFPCDRNEKWKPSQILIGVHPKDSTFGQIETFTALKSKLDWSYTRVMVVNMNGVHSIGGKNFPAYRIAKELNAKDTWFYFQKKSNRLSNEKMLELVKWRESCTKLYDSLWEESEKIRKLPRGQADSFLKLFQNFYLKDSETFYACQKLVRPGNIVEDNRRHWFFAYIQAFVLLEKNGFYFNCTDNAWAYNPKVDETRYFVNQSNELKRCRSRDFEKAFDQAINGMSLMKNQINRQFRFIEYDNYRGGSHQKIYGWVGTESRSLACKYDSKNATSIPFDIFPQDVVWETFKYDDDRIIQ